MLAFFVFLFLRPLAFRVSKNQLKLIKELPKIDKKGGLGWSRGLLVELLEAFESHDGLLGRNLPNSSQKRKPITTRDPPP